MTKPGPDLLALVGSRICHDLISPLGAIGNGLELLMMGSVANSPEMDLIQQSVENANARIRFFRVAFGQATADQALGGAELAEILTDCYKNDRIKLDCELPQSLSRPEAKLILLVVLCLEKTLPYGGVITLRQDQGDWRIFSKGDRMNSNEDLWQPITVPGVPQDLKASEVQFALLSDAAKRAGRALSVALSPEQTIVSF